MHNSRVTDRRRWRAGWFVLWVATLSLAALNLGCGNSASEDSSVREIPLARQLTQADHVGSVSADGRYLSFGREGEYEEFFVRDLMSGEDRLLAGRPGEVGSYGAPTLTSNF